MGQADVFSPFRRRDEGHEDRLTWGLMVTLKYIPELQRRLRDLVLNRLPPGRWTPEADWEPAAASTQTSRLGPGVAFVISVLLSDDSLPDPVGVQVAERTARYDGVLEYVDGLALIVENKPRRSNVWAAQLSPSLDSFDDPEEVEIFERAISLEWAEILETVLNYTSSPLASYPERSLGNDFIAFVEDLHPGLSPYRTFELCGGRRAALNRRIERLMEALGRGLGLEVGVRPRGQPYLQLPTQGVRQLHLGVAENPEDGQLVLRASLWPGDTVGQARPFLQKVDPEAFLALETQGWMIEPNLHFSHIQKHLVWAETSMGTAEYLAHYLANRGEIGRKNLGEERLEDLIVYWTDRGLISSPDAKELLRCFGETGRTFLNVVPGFGLTREWPMRSIMEMEAEGRLENELVAAIRIPLAAWGETVPGWNTAP